jgi:hypothetical protein
MIGDSQWTVIRLYRSIVQGNWCYEGDMNIHYLDTSAVNALVDDNGVTPRVLERFLLCNRVYVSCINLAEIGATKSEARRTKLVECLQVLGGNHRPLVFPSEGLRRSLAAYSQQAADLDWSIDDDLEGMWIALNQPGDIDERAVQELADFTATEEKQYQNMHDEVRPALQQAARTEGDPFGSGAGLIRQYCQRDDFLAGFFGPLIQDLGYDDLAPQAPAMIRSLEPWIFYFGALLHGVYDRALQLEGYGRRSHPGGLDSQQAIYLATCHCFVTNDRAQRRVLRHLARMGHVPRRVIDYSILRRSVLTPESC